MSNRSEAELVKEQSDHLRGSIVQELALETPGFSRQTVQILKFHGIYQQLDRDARKAGLQPVPGSMVRVGIPGGALSPDQYLVLDRLADEVGDGDLRITARQDIELHRVGKGDLHQLMQALDQNVLTTLAACGDVVRNVTCCPAPSEGNAELYPLARSLAQRLKPKTRAYYEIWLDGAKAAAAQTVPEQETLYGGTYLPRKFKIGIAAPHDNCVDVYSNDVGVVPVYGTHGLESFTLLVGGGLGVVPGVKASHPRLADPLCSVAPFELGETVEAIVALHRDFGNRSNRKLARLKYVIEEMGLAAFKAELQARLKCTLAPPAPISWRRGADHLGWQEQPDGRFFLGLPVISGRIKDTDGQRLRSGLREVVKQFRPGVRLTAQQNILLTGLEGRRRGEVEVVLDAFGIALAPQLPPVLRDSLACPALPLCALAVTEAERVLPDTARQIQDELEAAGLAALDLSVRVTGCANGCARPYTAEVGIVGCSVDLYALYLGGSHLGTRLGQVFEENVPRKSIGARLRPVFHLFRDTRYEGERFGDFCHRLGIDALRASTCGLAVEEVAS